MCLMARKSTAQKHEDALAVFALRYPGAYEENPWGHRAMKVRRKVFVFLACEDDVLSLSAKLPHSCREALLLPFAEPTGYGLGKSGWVSARFEHDMSPPLTVLCRWIDESYRTIAPKTLVKTLPESGPGDAPEPSARKTRKKA